MAVQAEYIQEIKITTLDIQQQDFHNIPVIQAVTQVQEDRAEAPPIRIQAGLVEVYQVKDFLEVTVLVVLHMVVEVAEAQEAPVV